MRRVNEVLEPRVRCPPEFRPLRRFMDDLRSFATRDLETPLRRLPNYVLLDISMDEWLKVKQEWQTENITSSREWETAVGAVYLNWLQDSAVEKRIEFMADIGLPPEMAIDTAFLLFPAEDYAAYLEARRSTLSEVYSIAASACLSLIKLELERMELRLAPIYRGDLKALGLLQSFRDQMTTRDFMRHYAPHQKIKPMRIEAVPLATSGM